MLENRHELREKKNDNTNLVDTLVAKEVYNQLDTKYLDPSLDDNFSNYWFYHNTCDPLFLIIGFITIRVILFLVVMMCMMKILVHDIHMKIILHISGLMH